MRIVRPSFFLFLLASFQASNGVIASLGETLHDDPDDEALIRDFLASVESGEEVDERNLGLLAPIKNQKCKNKLKKCQRNVKELSIDKWRTQIENLDASDRFGLQSDLRAMVDQAENADYTDYVSGIMSGENKISLVEATKLLQTISQIKAPKNPETREDFSPTVDSIKAVLDESNELLFQNTAVVTIFLVATGAIGAILAVPVGAILAIGLVALGIGGAIFVTAAVVLSFIVGGLILTVIAVLIGTLLLLLSPIAILIVMQFLRKNDEKAQAFIECEASLLKCQQDNMAAVVIPNLIRIAQLIDGKVNSIDPALEFTP